MFYPNVAHGLHARAAARSRSWLGSGSEVSKCSKKLCGVPLRSLHQLVQWPSGTSLFGGCFGLAAGLGCWGCSWASFGCGLAREGPRRVLGGLDWSLVQLEGWPDQICVI